MHEDHNLVLTKNISDLKHIWALQISELESLKEHKALTRNSLVTSCLKGRKPQKHIAINQATKNEPRI